MNALAAVKKATLYTYSIGVDGCKPFNVAAAKAGKQIFTRRGDEFVLAGVNYDAEHGEQVAGWVRGELLGYDTTGVFSAGSDLNLVMKG